MWDLRVCGTLRLILSHGACRIQSLRVPQMGDMRSLRSCSIEDGLGFRV